MSDDPLYWWNRAHHLGHESYSPLEGATPAVWPPQPTLEMVISHVDRENKRVFFEEGDPVQKTPYRIGPKFPPVAEGAPMETERAEDLPAVPGLHSQLLDALAQRDTERHGRLKLRRELRRVNKAVLKHKLLAERAQAEAARVVELNQKLATGELYRDIGKVQASAEQRADTLVYENQRAWSSWFGIQRFRLKQLIADAITEAIYADRLIRTAPATAAPKP